MIRSLPDANSTAPQLIAFVSQIVTTGIVAGVEHREHAEEAVHVAAVGVDDDGEHVLAGGVRFRHVVAELAYRVVVELVHGDDDRPRLVGKRDSRRVDDALQHDRSIPARLRPVNRAYR
jgi:hypothetical protein